MTRETRTPPPIGPELDRDLGDGAGSDVVVTVPKGLWQDWIAEGELAGQDRKWSGQWWHFFVGGKVPSRIPLEAPLDRPAFYKRRRGAATHYPERWDWLWRRVDWRPEGWTVSGPTSADVRCYVVAHGKLRGYSPLRFVEVDSDGKLLAFIRTNGAVAVTIPEPIRGFRGYRYRWWDRADEVPFPDWRRP